MRDREREREGVREREKDERSERSGCMHMSGWVAKREREEPDRSRC